MPRILTPSRRALLAASLALPFLPRPAPAQGFPSRTVRLVVGFPAGTGPDLVARILGEELRHSWPAGVAIDNRPGAGGQLAAQEIARAAPDGHSLLLGEVGTLAMAPSTHARLAYDPARDFAPIAEVAAIDFAFAIPASLPATDLAAWQAWARPRNDVFMGTFGAGTPGHFGAALLAARSGIATDPVHFRSTGEAMTALLAGQVQGMFGSVALLAPHVREGRLKALAVTGTQPSALMPGAPTMAQLGLADLTFEAWFGVVAPAATPEPLLVAAEAAIRAALAAPGARTRLTETGFRPGPADRAALAAKLIRETERWAAVVRQTGFRALE